MSSAKQPERADRHDDTQALPSAGQQDVGVVVANDVLSHGQVREQISAACSIAADIEKRIAVGVTRYGHPLQTFNGRDALLDAYEEALDCANYMKQICMERPADGQAKLVYWNALALVFSIFELRNSYGATKNAV
jgi:hypothetical protein